MSIIDMMLNAIGLVWIIKCCQWSFCFGYYKNDYCINREDDSSSRWIFATMKWSHNWATVHVSSKEYMIYNYVRCLRQRHQTAIRQTQNFDWSVERAALHFDLSHCNWMVYKFNVSTFKSSNHVCPPSEWPNKNAAIFEWAKHSFEQWPLILTARQLKIGHGYEIELNSVFAFIFDMLIDDHFTSDPNINQLNKMTWTRWRW